MERAIHIPAQQQSPEVAWCMGAARRSMHLGRGRAGVAGGWIRLVLEVDDIQARVASMKKAGLPFRNEIVTGPGGRQVLVEDPSGNPIEIFQAA